MFQIQIFAKIFWVYRYELRHDAICNCYLVRGRTSHTHIWFESMSFVLPHVFTSSKNCICLPNSYLDVIFSLHFHLYSENALQVARTVFRPIIFLQATLSLHWPAVNLSLCEVDSRIAKKDLFIRRSRAPPEKFQTKLRQLRELASQFDTFVRCPRTQSNWRYGDSLQALVVEFIPV